MTNLTGVQTGTLTPGARQQAIADTPSADGTPALESVGAFRLAGAGWHGLHIRRPVPLVQEAPRPAGSRSRRTQGAVSHAQAERTQAE
jgi:hypothetical protein